MQYKCECFTIHTHTHTHTHTHIHTHTHTHQHNYTYTHTTHTHKVGEVFTGFGEGHDPGEVSPARTQRAEREGNRITHLNTLTQLYSYVYIDSHSF